MKKPRRPHGRDRKRRTAPKMGRSKGPSPKKNDPSRKKRTAVADTRLSATRPKPLEVWRALRAEMRALRARAPALQCLQVMWPAERVGNPDRRSGTYSADGKLLCPFPLGVPERFISIGMTSISEPPYLVPPVLPELAFHLDSVDQGAADGRRGRVIVWAVEPRYAVLGKQHAKYIEYDYSQAKEWAVDGEPGKLATAAYELIKRAGEMYSRSTGIPVPSFADGGLNWISMLCNPPAHAHLTGWSRFTWTGTRETLLPCDVRDRPVGVHIADLLAASMDALDQHADEMHLPRGRKPVPDSLPALFAAVLRERAPSPVLHHEMVLAIHARQSNGSKRRGVSYIRMHLTRIAQQAAAHLSGVGRVHRAQVGKHEAWALVRD